jgi:glycosyltransferase involved in cell wall biosynthesis
VCIITFISFFLISLVVIGSGEKMRLSILIPAYNFPDGIKNILPALGEFVGPLNPQVEKVFDSFEILVFDDSDNDEVKDVVDNYKSVFHDALVYKKNIPATGAVKNWNKLLDSSNGEYVILLHHDEYPIGPNFICQTLKEIGENPTVDVFAMNVFLSSRPGRLLRAHLPNWFRQLVLMYFPKYLFIRNVVGPTSALIVRKDIYPRFDENLNWLVDSELFYRLRVKTANWKISNNISVGSVINHAGSITNKIRSNIKIIDSKEREYLSNKHKEASRWILINTHPIWGGIEKTTWIVFRIFTRPYLIMLTYKNKLNQKYTSK